MAKAYRYPLTRVCLRSGTMTLPLAMLELFPEGPIVAVDKGTGKEYELELTGPRVLAGLGPLYAEHELEVNDELHVAPLQGGRFSFEVVSRTKRSAAPATTALATILDDLATAGVPVTGAEVHALYPTLPADFDVTPYLAADPRFELRNGRWESAAARAAEAQAAPEPAARLSATVVDQVTELVGVPTAEAAVGQQAEHEPTHAAQQPPIFEQPRSSAIWQGFTQSAESAAPAPERGGHDHGAHDHGARTGHAERRAGARQGRAAQEAGGAATPQSAATPAPTERPGETRHVHERRLPTEPEPPEARELDDADLQVIGLAQRLRGVLEPLGYRLVPLGGGQVTIVADLGRRNYQVHAQLLPSGERLDWASLLAKRRASSARYLAVIGDHRDLLRLTSPAELARATLWSWEALERLRVLHGTVPVSPIDLESHFERDGLFESGLERFEQGVAARVAERGATSEVLTRLANLRAPCVFLLEELATDANMSREGVLRILERLSEAPFHLVARVDQGEFLLRMRVADALDKLAAYAGSLRERLPDRARERLTGLDDEPENENAGEVADEGLGGALEA